MSGIRVSKSIRKVIAVERDEYGRLCTRAIYRKRLKRKVSRCLRPHEDETRRTVEAYRIFAQEYLNRHVRSNCRWRDGWLFDYRENVYKAGLKALRHYYEEEYEYEEEEEEHKPKKPVATFRIRKGSRDIITISETGDVTFEGYYQEKALDGVSVGEFRIVKGSSSKLGTFETAGGRRNIRPEKRLFESALFPSAGLQVKHALKGVQAELHPDGDLFIRGKVANVLPDPARRGAFAFEDVVYAAPGLNYSSSPGLPPYVVFENPTPNYQTRFIDISDFADLSTWPIRWPFRNTNVPINGLLRIPRGPGPFPLVLIVHGNHSPLENSTVGYIYLLDLLASHGLIAGSVDCNFLNGFRLGEFDARAILHLEHIKQFQVWNERSGHPLSRKVDMSKVMIVGHSRGGEGVALASHFNRLVSVVPDPGDPPVPLDGSLGLGPYQFNLEVVVAIAPSAGGHEPVTGPVVVQDNYVIMHGSRDGCIPSFTGYLTFDSVHFADLNNPARDAKGFKSLLWIYGANHNFFNSEWAKDDNPWLSRADQENVAKVYLSAVAQGMLLGRSQYLDLLKDFQVGTNCGWIPRHVKLVSQYQDPQRAFINHYEQDSKLTTVSPPTRGGVSHHGIKARRLFFNQGPNGNLYQNTHGLKVDWSAPGGSYFISIDAGGLRTGKLHVLAFRAGQSDDPRNILDRFQSFTVILSDGKRAASIRTAHFAPLPYPALVPHPSRLPIGGVRRSVMQTLRIPLRTFAENGVDVQNIRAIIFRFDEPIIGTGIFRGSLYVDDIQLSH